MTAILLGLSGCVLVGTEEPTASPQVPSSVPDLWAWWAGELEGTAPHRTRLDRVLVTSPRTVDGTRVYYIQDGTGPGSALRVELQGLVHDWPPAVGTPIELSAEVRYDELGPYLIQSYGTEGRILGEPERVLPVPWTDAPTLRGALVRLEDITVTSAPDPLQQAELDQETLWGGAFGVGPPGWNAQGDLVGILTRWRRVSPRSADDWHGDGGDPPVQTDLATLQAGTLAPGTPVVLDATQATPWSQDGRFALLQDGDSEGVWVDAEGWAVDATEEGDRATWTGEVRVGPILRIWTVPEILGTGTITVGTKRRPASLVTLTVTGHEGPDAGGDWHSDDVVLEDLFLPLQALPDPLTVTGAVIERSGGTVRIAPVALP